MLLRQTDSDWEVRNFGFDGATVLRQGDIPYVNQNVYHQALASEPDYVIMCFGPNGSRSPNRGYIQECYVSDYLSLIESFLALPSKPKILICYPLKAFSDIYSFSDAIIKDQIIPLIAQVASEKNLPVIDFYTAFENSQDLYQSDGIHPNSAGFKLMAEIVAASLLVSQTPPDFNGDGNVDIEDILRLIESWGQDDPLVDMAPPLGDGVIDVLDLELLMSYWKQIVDDPTLIAHWTLDETEGITARDNVNGNDNIVIGGALWQPNGGQVNGAIQLDGVDDVIVADHILNLANRSFSVLAWIKGGAAGQTIISEQGGSNWLSVNLPEGFLMTELTEVDPSGGPLQSKTIVVEDDWHRVGLVWDGSQRMLYVDGITVAEDKQVRIDFRGSGLYIGCDMNMGSGTYWSGLIDDVRIYNRVVKP
jgi:lysophospholipase L1-like esterase